MGHLGKEEDMVQVSLVLVLVRIYSLWCCRRSSETHSPTHPSQFVDILHLLVLDTLYRMHPMISSTCGNLPMRFVLSLGIPNPLARRLILSTLSPRARYMSHLGTHSLGLDMERV